MNKMKKEIVFTVISISVYFALVNFAIRLSYAINIPNSINALTGIIFMIGGEDYGKEVSKI